jgi:DNA-directed RNA polymerase specialized sigma24 family protein
MCFFGYAARAMRSLIIDFMRERQALKRGGEFCLTSPDTAAADAVPQVEDFVPLGDAIDELAAVALAELVDLTFFCGFSFLEIAQMRNASDRTIKRHPIHLSTPAGPCRCFSTTNVANTLRVQVVEKHVL